jgi:hypothetical protein
MRLWHQAATWILLLAGAVRADDAPKDAPAEEKKKTIAEIEIAPPGTEIQDAAVARQEGVRFLDDMRSAKTEEDRVEALERVGRWNHPEILKNVSKYVGDRADAVAIAAIEAVARQTHPKAKDKAGASLYKQFKREKRTDVLCALMVGMGVVGYDNKAAVKDVTKYLVKDTTLTFLAAARYIGYVKYKPAFRLLAEKLDEPKSTLPVDDERNPPASWWKERWEEWERNVPYTRWALSQIVPGETFVQTAEAKGWAEANGREHGIEW